MNDLVIDETNFSLYFRDCRNSRPEKNDVIARYASKAEFIEGQMKKDIIDLLLNKDKAVAATQVLVKLAHATHPDAVRVCREICEDLASGMSLEDVEKKPYSYLMEMFFYTKKEYIPEDDPHWSPIGIANLDTFLDKAGNEIQIKSNLIEKEIQHDA